MSPTVESLMNEYLTEAECAKVLRFKHMGSLTNKRLRSSKLVPPFVKRGTGTVLYPVEGVKKWLKEQEGYDRDRY